MKNAEISVSLVEDNPPLAEELERRINRSKGLHCLSVYTSGEAALKHLPKAPPDVVLVDLRLPGLSGVDLIRELRTLCPEVQCLVLTMYAESNLIFEALKAGACGYLLKRTRPAEIADAIRQVHAGGSVLTPLIARKVLEIFSKPTLVKTPVSEDSRLTDREKNVLQCMAEGQTRKRIVDSIGINTFTLDRVIRCIYRKLHVNCVAAAVSTALREGLVSPKK